MLAVFPPLPQALLALQIELSDSARLTGRDQGLATHGCFEQSPVRLIWQPCGRRGEAAVLLVCLRSPRLERVVSHALTAVCVGNQTLPRGGGGQSHNMVGDYSGDGRSVGKIPRLSSLHPPTPLFLEGQKAPL